MARRNRHGLPLHVSPAPDRHGKTRLRFRKGLYSTYLHAPLDTEEFWQEYQAALAGVKAAARTIGATRHRPGSIAAVALAYYQSPEFVGLRDSTKAVRRGIIDRFVRKAGQDPVRQLERKHVKAIIGGMAATPHAANNLLKALRLLLDFAVDVELIERNPAHGIKGIRVATKGFVSWTEADIAGYEKAHPIGTRARLAMALLLYTGQRRGDVVRMGWQHVVDQRIALRQEKTGVKLILKIHPALSDALAHTERSNLTFLITEQGAPFTPAGFGNLFRQWCDEAGLKGLSAHGLRKAAARRIANAGRSTKQIQALTGHATLQQVDLYTRASDQMKLADEAVDSMPDRSDREQSFPNLKPRLDKKPRKALK
jgi:integrase